MLFPAARWRSRKRTAPPVLAARCARLKIGKLVKIQHGPATVSVRVRSHATVPVRMGRRTEPLKRKSGDRPRDRIQEIRTNAGTERTAAKGCPLIIMRKLCVCALLSAAFALSVPAAELKGVVMDPAQRPIPGARVAAFNSLG